MRCVLFLLSLGFLSSVSLGALVVTEIHYNGTIVGTDTDEFIEIYNTGPSPVDLAGYSFTQGFSYTFSSVTLGAGELLILTVSETGFRNSVDFDGNAYLGILIEWDSGGLSNGGENITLVDTGLSTVFDIDYDDRAPWPGIDTDGNGQSIQIINPNAANPVDPSNFFGGAPTPGSFIPEPSSALLLVGGLMSLFLRRRS